MNGLFRATMAGLLAAVLSVSAWAGNGEYLMVSGSASDFRGVALFDPVDGSLVESGYIDFQDSSGVLKHAVQVGDEIWIAAQLAAVIHRFTLEGDYIGDIEEAMPGQPLNNIRGMGIFEDTVYLTNSGDSGGAPGPALVLYDFEGNWLDTFTIEASPFSVLYFNGVLLTGHQSGTLDIQQYDLDGNHLGAFHEGPISWVQQMSVNAAGNVLATGWSSNGLYEFDPDGNQVDVIDASSPRGVWELENGNILWASGSGVQVYDVKSGTNELILDMNGQYIDLLVLDVDPEPCPGDLNGSGSVGVPDLLILINEWGTCDDPDDCPADLTGSGTVGVPDLLVLINNWGDC